MRRYRAGLEDDLLGAEDAFAEGVSSAANAAAAALEILSEMDTVLPHPLEQLLDVDKGWVLDTVTDGPELWEELGRYAASFAAKCRQVARLSQDVLDASSRVHKIERTLKLRSR